METGTAYSKQRLHGKRYFQELLGGLEEVPDSVREMPRFSRSVMETFEAAQQRLLRRLGLRSEVVAILAGMFLEKQWEAAR
jgi:hypothetical protein